MTRDIDRLIEEALAEDERALLAKIGDEPGYFRQARDTFKGPLGWVVWLIYILNIVCFIGFVFATWKLFAASDVMAALRWAFAAIVLINFTLFFKGSMGAHGEANRVLREVRRLELQVMGLKAGRGD